MLLVRLAALHPPRIARGKKKARAKRANVTAPPAPPTTGPAERWLCRGCGCLKIEIGAADALSLSLKERETSAPLGRNEK
jgi:hypothetical protein